MLYITQNRSVFREVFYSEITYAIVEIVISDHFALCARIFAVHVQVVVYTWRYRCTGSRRLRSYYWYTNAIHLQTDGLYGTEMRCHRFRRTLPPLSVPMKYELLSSWSIILVYIHMSIIQILSLLFNTESFFTCRLLYIFSCLFFLAFYLKATLSCSIRGPRFFFFK